ncbi:hypothetical protein PEL8287_03184 [Roseovarius litorisediminis]|uniref:DUF2946 domain-containing protein n=2 Tax=Roseovarius litorisediminis TaxID=1312363 RepID=A0A1Y5T9U2_9RHOB|nr:hypothetical protein PEL8287_03184 [Roseovarius litorisediminis]
MRPYLGFALCLMLAITSHSAAVARGAPGPAGQMVLCTGTGPVTVLVDAQGQPTGAVHICPDYALALFAALDSPAALPLYFANSTLLHTIEIKPEIEIFERPAFQARAPPLAS